MVALRSSSQVGDRRGSVRDGWRPSLVPGVWLKGRPETAGTQAGEYYGIEKNCFVFNS